MFQKRLRALIANRARLWTYHPLIVALTLGTALVWLVFGIWFKIFGMVPRHRLIVAAVVGEAAAGPVTMLVGVAETAMALWILSGLRPLACALAQSIAIATMNALELSLAPDLLLAPSIMVLANTVFLVVVWYCALKGSSDTVDHVMLATLRRHPIPIQAFFRHSLVLTYAFPEEILRPLLPPGLTLDSYEGSSFLAIALVQVERLRPVGLPAAFGRNFFLSGYRIFSRYRGPDGKVLRGLRILRSDADSSLMVWGGNLLTHYRYTKCIVKTQRTPETLEIVITTPRSEADLSVRALIEKAADSPPSGSPFADLKIARHYAGPLPFTFDYEPESGQMVIVEGIRQNWNPKPVRVDVHRCSYLEKPPFNSVPLRLANAFFIENIPYSWQRGVVAQLPKENA